MRILVTGASGYIGKHLIPVLLDAGHEVIATSTDFTKISGEPWYSRVRYIEKDLYRNDTDYYEEFLRPDSIVHLAWRGLPNYSELFHIERNLLDNYLFLQKMIIAGTRDITVLGTCLEYGTKEGKLSEDMVTNPTCSYGVAKDALQRFLDILRKKVDFNLKWIRLFYIYGADQSSSLIGQLENAVQRGESTFPMSLGQQSRDFLNIEIAVDYIARISLQKHTQGIINCCSSNPIKVCDFVEKYIKDNNYDIKPNFGVYPYNDYEAMNFYGDNAKLLKLLKKEELYVT